MENEFIPYEQALDLKELGFTEPCIAYYNGYKELDHLMPERVIIGRDYNGETITSAPLYQQAFRWFREKYQIDSCIHRNGGMNIDERGFLPYYEIIIRHKSPELKCVKYSYEEAELECLKKLIEIVKNKHGKN
jgi:hypothetical protein